MFRQRFLLMVLCCVCLLKTCCAFAALQTGGNVDDDIVSLIYDPGDGRLGIDPAAKSLFAIDLRSEAGWLTFFHCPGLDVCTPTRFFNIGPAEGGFGLAIPRLPSGLSETAVAADLSAVVFTRQNETINDVDLVYVPEPSVPVLLLVLLPGMLRGVRVARRPWDA